MHRLNKVSARPRGSAPQRLSSSSARCAAARSAAYRSSFSELAVAIEPRHPSAKLCASRAVYTARWRQCRLLYFASSRHRHRAVMTYREALRARSDGCCAAAAVPPPCAVLLPSGDPRAAARGRGAIRRMLANYFQKKILGGGQCEKQSPLLQGVTVTPEE